MTLRIFAHGGGVQSTAALVLSAQHRIDFPVHLFANVGDDSENPATLRYVHEISMPYASEHGVDLIEIHRVTRDGREITLLEDVTSPSRTVGIPVRMGNNGAPGTRRCTYQFKMAPIKKWLKSHGASKSDPAFVGIGISMDEVQRIGRVLDDSVQRREYPLIDLRLRRLDCLSIIAAAGLPEPPKSSCYFCPFHRPAVWSVMRRDEPELFEKAAELEDLLNLRRDELGKDHVYLSRFGRSLRHIGEAQQTMFDAEMDNELCDEGVCFV